MDGPALSAGRDRFEIKGEYDGEKNIFCKRCFMCSVVPSTHFDIVYRLCIPGRAITECRTIGYVQEFRFEYDSLSDLLPQLPLTDTTRYCEEYNEEYQATYSGQLPLVSINRIGDSERFEAVYKGMITRVPG